MKNINQLERKRKEILNDMNEEEIIKVYENLSDEYVSYIGSYKNGFNYTNTMEETERIIKRFEGLDSDLKGIYKTDVLYFSSLAKSFFKGFVDANEKIHSLYVEYCLIIQVLNLSHYMGMFRYLFKYLNFHLMDLYHFYEFRYAFNSNYKLVDYITEKFNLDFNKDEDLKIMYGIDEEAFKVDKEFHKESFERLEKVFDSNIERLVKDIDKIISELNINNYLYEKTIIPEGLDEEVVQHIENIIKTKEEAKQLIEEYEELKDNPFKEAIELSVKFDVENSNRIYELNKESFEKGEFKEEPDEVEGDPVTIEDFNFLIKDYDEELAKALNNAPKYDFTKFKIIVPEEEKSEEGS